MSFSFLWILICADIISVAVCPSITHYIDYCFFASIFCCGVNLFSKKVYIDIPFLTIAEFFLLFIGLQLVGMLQMQEFVSVRNICSSCCVLIWLLYLRCGKINFKKKIIYSSYIVTMVVVLFWVIDTGGNINTLPAEIAFLTCSLLFIGYEKKNNMSKHDYFLGGTALYFSVLIAWLLHSRTVIFSIGIVLLVYCMVHYLHITKMAFWWLVAILALGIYTYISITDMPFFNDLNMYSAEIWGKSINSGRDYLWKVLLNSVSGVNVIIGSGTGTLPIDFLSEVDRYSALDLFETGSSHSTYIQIYIQNGLIGLSLFLWIMYLFFKTFATNLNTDYGKLALAVLVGIMFYNSFECTLLQNKVFIGSLQWTSLGIAYRKVLENIDHYK